MQAGHEHLAQSLTAHFDRWDDDGLRFAAAKQQQLLRMALRTFVNIIIQLPAQVVRSGRHVVLRLLGGTPHLDLLFRLLDGIAAVT